MRADRELLARLGESSDGRVAVLAPRVGVWSSPPAEGLLLGPGSPIGMLQQLRTRFALVLPEGAGGRVLGTRPRRVVAVEYGEPLFWLVPVAALGPDGSLPLAGGVRATGEGPESRSTAVVAPTDGVFYRRPTPDSSPFVEIGSRIRAGQPIGLVEVMKTFNQILYGGPGLPEEAEVVEIRCGDGEEVRAGQPLLIVR